MFIADHHKNNNSIQNTFEFTVKEYYGQYFNHLRNINGITNKYFNESLDPKQNFKKGLKNSKGITL